MSRTKTYNRKEKLHLAIRIFWENGYEASSINMLVKSMGMSRSSLYQAFESKENLFIESLEEYLSQVKIVRFHPLTNTETPKETIRDFFISVADSMTSTPPSNGCLIVNSIAELSTLWNGNERVQTIFKEFSSTLQSSLNLALVYGVKNKSIRSVVDSEKYSHILTDFNFSLLVQGKLLSRNELYRRINYQLSFM